MSKYKKYCPKLFTPPVVSCLLTLAVLLTCEVSAWFTVTPVAAAQTKASAKSSKPSSLPQKTAPLTGVVVKSNAKASVDASNLGEGYVTVKYTGGRNVKIKVQITKQSGVTYTYNLNNGGNYETFCLSEGDGKYTVAVFENVSGDKYTQAYSCTLDMTLRNDFLPFLYSNQYVNYDISQNISAKSVELAKTSKTEMETLQNIYYYVVQNLTYDTELAATVTSGYLPNLDKTLESKKGICFDYAALMTAMLRLRNIPCKLVVGYAGKVYHAWINVYIEEIGWIDKAIYFDGKNWTLMDPTFVSTAKSSKQVMEYVSDGKNYSQKFVY